MTTTQKSQLKRTPNGVWVKERTLCEIFTPGPSSNFKLLIFTDGFQKKIYDNNPLWNKLKIGMKIPFKPKPYQNKSKKRA